MQQPHLADLDELAMQARDRTSREYILEAISDFRVGSYRSAITATWIAVSYDLISKIRELSEQGDKNASAFIATLDGAIKAKAVMSLQKIENELLEKARDEFELLNDSECRELLRLKEDRNYCAHPALVSDLVLFQPTADATRAHIVHAVIYVLRAAPVQGKSAIAQVLADISGFAFPTDQESAFKYMRARYLERAKRAFVDNLVDVLAKQYLVRNDPAFAAKDAQLLSTLAAIDRLHPEAFREKLKAKLPGIVGGTTSSTIVAYLFRWISHDARVWEWLGQAQQIRFASTVEQLAFDKPEELGAFALLEHPVLGPALQQRFEGFPEEHQRTVIRAYPHRVFAGQALAILGRARGFRDAEDRANEVIVPMISLFTATDVKGVLAVVMTNGQVSDSFGISPILTQLFDETRGFIRETAAEWQLMLKYQMERHHDNDYYSLPEIQERLQAEGIPVLPVAPRAAYVPPPLPR